MSSINVCPVCGEEAGASLQEHLLSSCRQGSSADPAPPREVAVQFTWQPVSNLSFETITLLSAFQSVEMKLEHNSLSYTSDVVMVPVGEYEGQLIIGNSFIYPVHKFLVVGGKTLVSLEIDISQLEKEQPQGNTHYHYGYEDRSSGGREGSINITYNPAYTGSEQSTNVKSAFFVSGYGDEPYGEYGPKASPVEVINTSPSYRRGSRTLATPPPEEHSSSEDGQDMESEFSRELSAQGFSPAPVKSKLSQRVPSKSSSYTNPAPLTTTPTTPNSSPSLRTEGVGQSGGFTTADFQSGDLSREQLQERLMEVTQDRDRLQANLQRVSAQWEGKVRRLQKQLEHSNIYSGNEDHTPNYGVAHSVAELQLELEQLKENLRVKQEEFDDEQKQVTEMKDRHMALENQLSEYLCTINDQAKLIQRLSSSELGGKSPQLSQMTAQCEYMVQFSKKQQLEYQQSIANFKEEIDSNRSSLEKKIEARHDEIELLALNKSLAEEVEQYRVQTKKLVADMSSMDKELESLRIQVALERHTEHSGSELELATLRDKYQAYRVETERLVAETDELQRALQEAQLEKEQLVEKQEELEQLLKSALDEQALPKQAHGEPPHLFERYTELQQLRTKQESELAILRSERADMLQQNAELLEASNPDKYSKLKKEHGQLTAGNKQLQRKLEEEKETVYLLQEQNLALKQQLEEATNPDKLEVIQQKIGRYKQERDAARGEVQNLKLQLQVMTSELQQKDSESMRALQSERERGRTEVQYLKGKVKKYKEDYKQISKTIDTMKTRMAEKTDTIEHLREELASVGGRSEDNLTSESSTSKEDVFSLSSLSLSSSAVGDGEQVAVGDEGPLTPLSLEEAGRWVEQRVLVKRKGGVVVAGTLKFVGPVPGVKEIMAGIALDMPRTDPKGSDNNGTFKNGVQYFKCSKGHGLYTPLSNVFYETL